MSNLSGQTAEFDFWEFVNCGVCHLEFSRESGALSSIPFWLTDCGHVVCNTHLNADQTCAVCGNPKMQLMPLQRELEPPLSNWFGSVSQGFDTVAFSLRFQLSTMATLVRYLKKKYHQYRPLHERCREQQAETKRLRKMVDELRIENSNLRQQLHMSSSGNAQGLNVNGKRARMDDDGYYSGQRTSSPRSTATPIGPDRLTLPLGHHRPQFNSRQSLQVPGAKPEKQNIQHFAYVPPRSAQAQSMAMPILSHIQSGSARRALGRAEAEDNTNLDETSMQPPTRPSRRLEQHAPLPRADMPPPPTPQLRSGSKILSRQPSSLPPGTPQLVASGGSQRFVPQTPGSMGRTTSTSRTSEHVAQQPQPRQNFQTQRFAPPGSSRRLPMASASSSGSLAPSGSVSSVRAPSLVASTSGGQRTPFIPGNGSGFS